MRPVHFHVVFHRKDGKGGDPSLIISSFIDKMQRVETRPFLACLSETRWKGLIEPILSFIGKMERIHLSQERAETRPLPLSPVPVRPSHFLLGLAYPPFLQTPLVPRSCEWFPPWLRGRRQKYRARARGDTHPLQSGMYNIYHFSPSGYKGG